MKTLLVYFSENKAIAELCSASERDGEVDVLEINSRYYKNILYKTTVYPYLAFAGLSSKIKDIDTKISEYDNIIIATTLVAGNISPEINEFLHKNNLLSKDVTGLVLSSKKASEKPLNTLRNRIGLAGGNCRDAVYVSTKELKENEYDVFSYAQENLFGALV